MNKRIKCFTFLLLLTVCSFAQNNEASSSSQSSTTASKKTIADTSINSSTKKEFVFKPTVGLGVGMLSFYGDLYNKHFQPPMVSRIGYELIVGQQLTNYLQLNFYVLYGKLAANENESTNNRNLNFESQIRTGGINLTYNFGNFLPAIRNSSPYISLGIESLEFLSKTDMYDKYGNKYYYWSDGSVKNIDENATNANQAVLINRDYTYESDVREKNLDGFGKYQERSWAIPIGVGAIFKINDYFDFKIGTALHLTFTDYIDGVTSKSTGNRAGTANNDHFMMTSCSIHYNLGLKKSEKEEEEMGIPEADYLALDMEDQDKDGVVDTKDSCQGTPAGVVVDTKGCPVDDDNGGVPNYLDDEINSPKNAFVDEKGVQLTDSIIAYRYNVYMDSTGAFAKVEVRNHNGRNAYNNANQKEYTVSLGTFKKGLPAELMTKFLSISDIASTNIDDSTTMYTAGKYNNLQDATKRKIQLSGEGIANAKVVFKQNGKYQDAPIYASNVNTNSVANTNKTTTNNVKETNNTTNNVSKSNTNTIVKSTTENSSKTNENKAIKNTTNNNENKTEKENKQIVNNSENKNTTVDNNAVNVDGIVLRVQLGAYKNRLSKNVFKDISDLIEIKTEDGLYKYMTGSFTVFEDAAKHKVNMLLKGYQGAFIAAYKNGKRVPLENAGATKLKKEDIQKELSDTTSNNATDKKLIVFKIQVGAFKNQPPDDKLELYKKIDGITITENKETGIKRYTVGSFNDYKTAQIVKEQLAKNYGITDAFLIAFYNSELISIQEALELLK